MTRIGLGLAALGRPAYINAGRDADLGADRSASAMERHCHAMLDAAFDVGIRYVDAARSYELAESFLASWLEERRFGPGSIVVGSKWGYTYTGDWRMNAPTHEVKDLSFEALAQQASETRALLGRHLGLYQIHSATLESGVLDDRRVLDELARLRSEGLAIGLTVTGPEQGLVLRRALKVNVEGVNPFQVVQATWNLLETSVGPSLAEAKAHGWGVIVKEALGNGRLTDRYAGNDIGPVRRLASRVGASIDAVAIAGALSQPWADVVLSGAVTPAQLQSNLHALDVEVNGDEWPSMAEPPVAYWARRHAFGWT